MVKKNWIAIICCVAVAVLLCTVTYAEKGEKKGSLPAAIEAAVKALFPNAVIEKSEKEEEEVKMYEVELKEGDKKSTAKLTEDGTLVEIESVETIEALPAAVANVIKAQNGKIKNIEKAVEHAQLKVVKLDAPVTSYETEIIKDGKEIEIKIAADGTILEQKEEKKKDKEKEEHDKD